MRRAIRSMLCLLAVCSGLSGQTVVKSSGGASSIGSLGGVVLTSETDGDGLRVDASGDFVNTALFTPGTTDLRADRMSTNVLAAVGGGLTNDRVVVVSGGSAATSASLRWTSPSLTGAPGGLTPSIRFGNVAATTPAYSWTSDPNTGLGLGGIGFFHVISGSNVIATFGGSNTALKKDTTPTTGITRDRCEDGAGQGVVACHQVESFAAFDGITFSELSTHANGSYTYCTDCTKATPCASGGSGAFAKRINGAWDCD